MNYTILGCGRWGSFIAWYLDKTGHKVTTWGLDTDPYVTNFFATRKNNFVTFPETIELTTDLDYAVNKNDNIIISISSQSLRSLMGNVQKIDSYKNKNYVLCMKGIEEATGERLSQVMIESGVPQEHIAVWVGPGHIQDFVRGVPGVMVIDSYSRELAKTLIADLRSDLIKYYLADDIVGTEIGAAAKNVVGIAAGMLDGLGYQSLKGALMARGTHEVSKLIEAAGGKKMSAYGLCHLGDYEATLFSPHSNNRKFGELFVQHEYFDKLAEGVKTSTALLNLAEQLSVDMPITKAVNDAIIHGKDFRLCLKELFGRENITEF
jgi:glycerol-3-phosphate dehydrogenase (NAD(P)+)